jgi:SAM-dependent methyltransferase
VHPRFLDYLADPLTGERLQVEDARMKGDRIESGVLTSALNRFPIIHGVPRFIGHGSDPYAGSFGYQWNRWSRLQFESENVGGPMEGYTLRMWERITGIDGAIPGQVLVDVGCGPGRFIDVARRKGARVIGIDYSEAVEVAARNFAADEDVCICQADALHLPIATAAADGAFSIGVLHHTPAPFDGVRELSRVIAPSGWMAVSVYGKGGYYDFPTVRLWRGLFNRLWPALRHYPPLLYSYATVYGLGPIASIPLVGQAIRAIVPFVHLPDRRWSLLDTFDSVTPSYQSAHTSYEVFQWFKACGLDTIEPTDWGSTAYRGTRKSPVALTGS